MGIHRPGRLVPGLALVLVASALPAAEREAERHSFRADRLHVRNLIGQVSVEGHAGPGFEVEVRFGGADHTPDRLRVDTRDGRDASVEIVFPIEESRRYVYPRLGGGETSFDLDRTGSWLSNLLGTGKRIEVSGDGSGLELWADVTVRVPSGASLRVEHGVGEIAASGIGADLELVLRSGQVRAERIDGNLSVDTGSGAVHVETVRGAVLVDTGSGDVSVRDCVGDNVVVDTGSGSVEVENIEAHRFVVDTGSGDVRAHDVGADDVDVDTGSGSVEIDLAKLSSGSVVVDTGSGRIRLGVPAGASAEIHADTGSGGIRVDMTQGYDTIRQDRDEMVLRIGSGSARVTLDTGSGGIRVSDSGTGS